MNKLHIHKCKRCGYRWASRKAKPQTCASKTCRSPYWNKRRTNAGIKANLTKLKRYVAVVVLMVLTGAPFIPNTTVYAKEPEVSTFLFIPHQPTIEEIITEKMGPEMVGILDCESDLMHERDGQVVIGGPNKNGTIDIGIAQINSIHVKRANELGYDIFTLEGNLDYASVLYKEHKTQPWVCSDQ